MAHFGDFQETPVYYRTDSLRNILSNKYTALYRMAAKDVVDIWEICLNTKDWNDIINEANQKEVGSKLTEVIEILQSYPDEKFLKLNWKKSFDLGIFKKDLKIIMADILSNKTNSLA